MKRLFPKSIKKQLFLMGLIVALPAAGVIIYSGYEDRNEAINVAYNDIQNLSDAIATEQKNLAASAQQLVEVLAQLPEVKSHNTAKINHLLGEILKLNPQYLNIFVTDHAGMMWASAVPLKTPVSVADRRFYRNALATGQFSSGEYVTSRSTDKPTLGYGYPYKNQRGVVDGVIGVSFDLEHFRKLLQHAKLPPGFSYLIIDHRGVIISRGINPEELIGKTVKPELLKRMKEGPDGGIFTGLGVDNIDRFSSYRKMYLSGEQTPYMYIRTGVPVKAVVAKANKYLFFSLALFSPLMMIAFFFVWVIGKRAITDRISVLQSASQRLAGGDLDVRVGHFVQGGELGELANSFDAMADALAIDIKSRKKAEEEVALKNMILSTQQETSLDGILVVDESHTIVSYNRRFVEMWGTPSELVDAGAETLVMQHVAAQSVDPEGFLARVGYLYARREEKTREEILLKDGRMIDRYSTPMTDADGKYYGRVWYSRDITELHRAKQDMLRTQKLESLGVLAGGIAHDFNNILTAVLGNISLARFHVQEPAKVTQRLEDAEIAAVRAKDLTQQLLTFARGGEPIKKGIMLGGLLKEAAGFAIHGSAVNITFALGDNLWPVEADEGQLSQVIHNLVLNAIQAMPTGGKITVAAHNADSRPDGKKFVKISVADTGTGIPENLLQNIFDPYFTTKQQGSGLGLATCYSIIRKHDGKIRVESTIGMGTTFYISLPAAERVEETKPAERMEVAHGKGRVLVMDDEEIVRETAKTMLEELGYQVECTEDGSEAIELYKRRKNEGTPFASVLMDLTIPGGIGGKEAIKSLIEIDSNVKAIVSSGYSSDPVMANYRDYGFSAVLSKPYRLQEMSTVLQELIKG